MQVGIFHLTSDSTYGLDIHVGKAVMSALTMQKPQVANCSVRKRPLCIPLYIPEKKEKLNPSDYQVYKLQTNPKDKTLAMYSLMVIKGQDIQDLESAYTLVKSLLWGDTLQDFQNKKAFQKEREGLAFTKYIGLWKLEFEKEGFGKGSASLKEFLAVYMHLEESELHKLLAKKIACAQKEHDESKGDGKARCLEKLKLHNKRHNGNGKCHAGKCKKKHCNYHGLCHHDTEECQYYKACRKHVQLTHHITEEQRLRQVCFLRMLKGTPRSAA
eukprot:15365162-Ditylum_brightwellii.AAC.1